ncbi:hypothetical protein SmJEL517_g00411 [Synchytrium microbalum]|uniref:Uncharacterized protein n=1 Tax=Synchytrium microbalum TaxID=1806994 RepID=A0A507CF08_9FUNG|nr:uncharacterized protein SmJEL517_g00411 [Synchytrium microbalum]TPX38212.1 hypothetical protein SmJEL517_g00411 [Synchytrium microbalum]
MATSALLSYTESVCLAVVLEDALNQLSVLDDLPSLPNDDKSLKTLSGKQSKSSSNTAQNTARVALERANTEALLSRAAREIREVRQFTSLSNAVKEESERRHALQNTLERENAAVSKLASLKQDLAREKTLLEEELTEASQAAQELRDTISEVTVSATVEQKFIRKETVAHEESARQQCSTIETKLMEENQLWLRKIELEDVAHEKIMEFLTRQREDVERQVEEWMVKYEQDTEAKATAIENIKHERATNVDKFEQLVQMFEELEHAMEEERKKAEDEKKLMMQKSQSARRLQRWWRGQLEKKRASAKAKKPKGKKK